MRRLFSIVAVGFVSLAFGQAPLELRIIHTNDLHAHPAPFEIGGKSYGGYARQATAIKGLRAAAKHSILLNAGDTFQGTMYFDTYQGLADLAAMNVIGYDAACTGNHEFDLGPGALSQFAQMATFPVLAANLDVSGEPLLSPFLKPSAILTVDGQRVGIVGAVTPDLPSLSLTGPTVKMKDLASSVQAEVDALEAAGVNKIVVLSHIGYEEDLKLAGATRGIDAIVGGHSHSPLGTPELAGWRKAVGPYPTMATTKDGKKVPIVQAYEWSKVVGHIDLSFDVAGNVAKIGEAGVTVIDDSIEEDKTVASLVAAFSAPIAAKIAEVVGEAGGAFPKETDHNVMANTISDAMMQEFTEGKPAVAVINAGGVRAPLDPGVVTFGELQAVQPFKNKMTTLELAGDELLAALEEGVPDPDKTGGLLYPSKGSSYTVDFRKPAGSRVSEVIIAGKPLDKGARYLVLMNDFTASGGDAHVVLQNAAGTRNKTALVDLDLLLAFFAKHKPVMPDTVSRVKVIR